MELARSRTSSTGVDVMVLGDHAGGDVSAALADAVERAEDPSRRTGCEVERDGPKIRVRLWGSLPAAWCGHLSLHCRAAGLSIVAIDGLRLACGRWAAMLGLESTRSDVPAPGCDFLAMARRRPALAPPVAPIGIHSLALGPAEDGQALWLGLRAPDRLGLLAEILGRIEACGLRVIELRVRTDGGTAEDRLRLVADSGKEISDESIDRLRGAFEPLLRVD